MLRLEQNGQVCKGCLAPLEAPSTADPQLAESLLPSGREALVWEWCPVGGSVGTPCQSSRVALSLAFVKAN